MGARKIGFGCVFLLTLWATPALAFECNFSKRQPHVSLKWEERTLLWGIEANSYAHFETLLPESPDIVMNAAFTAWSLPACTDLQFQYVGLVSESDSVSQVSVVQSGWVEGDRNEDAVAVAVTTARVNTGFITRVDIEFNEDLFDFVDARQSCFNAHDVQAILTHEVGHFIGLDHTPNRTGIDETEPTMAASVNPCRTGFRTLEEDDKAGVCFLYPLNEPVRSCAAKVLDSDFLTVGGSSCVCTEPPERSGAARWGIGLFLGWVFMRRKRTELKPG